MNEPNDDKRASVESVVMQWHSMDSAPKDGTPILIALHASISQEKRFDVMYYQERPFLGQAWTEVQGLWSCGVDCAIGWMPLASIPECTA